jgi:hypothetical protein
MRHREKKMRHSEKKRKTGPLIVLVLEIMVIIVMHAVKINRLAPGAEMKTGATVQQFPAGRVLLVTPKPPRHVPELFEDCLAAAAETKIIFFY